MISNPSCSACAFFDKPSSECRRGRPLSGPDREAFWPQTRPQAWCGEFRSPFSAKARSGSKPGRPALWNVDMVREALGAIPVGSAPIPFSVLLEMAAPKLKGIHRATFSGFVGMLVTQGWLTRTAAGYVRTPEEV